MQVGLVVMDENPADALRVARAADRAGVHSPWSIDYYNRSSLTRATAFAAVAETSIVGTSVTPPRGSARLIYVTCLSRTSKK
jgi:alkanesulfonate monooxygenase SsuD/methylene tetrahydromethanopterin reductase-like flavin-dependent oxidoreductase (luciferase family)